MDKSRSSTCKHLAMATSGEWNPSIAATLGEQRFGRYIGVAFILYRGLFCTQTVHFGTWVPGRYTEVAVERGSTVVSLLYAMCIYQLRSNNHVHYCGSNQHQLYMFMTL